MKIQVCFLLMLFLFIPPVLAKKENRPNIIIIMVDTLRADYLGSYGFDGNVSPNIDKFANQSFQFTNAISPAPWTKPAIASLFTAHYPETHRVTGFKYEIKNYKTVGRSLESNVLTKNALTLAEVLKKNGYQTIGITQNGWVSSRFGFAQGFDEFYEHLNIYGFPFEKRSDAKQLKSVRVINEFKTWYRERRKDKPFFAYLHYIGAHGPYFCSESHVEEFLKSKSLGEEIEVSDEKMTHFPPYMRNGWLWNDPIKKKSIRNWRACYAGAIQGFDWNFRKLIQFLNQQNLFENSIVIFTSDHGEEFLEHGRWDHGYNLHFESIDIPLLVRLPGNKRQAKKINESINLVDLMPTILSLVNISYPKKSFQGIDYSHYFEVEQRKGPEYLYASGVKFEERLKSIQNEKYKLIWHLKKGDPELYDMVNDPTEQSNIAKENQKVRKKLQRALLNHLKFIGSFKRLVNKSTVLTDPQIENLRSLGYLQ